MSTITHQQNGYSPTGRNIYVDVEKILEELLEKRTDESVRHCTKVRRIQTGPNVGKGNNHTNGSEHHVVRTKTLPANYREPHVKELAQTDLNIMLNNINRIKKIQHEARDELGSSADTEDNLSVVSDKQKKKSFLKRAKERILFTIHREQKGKSGNSKDKNNQEIANLDKQKSDQKKNKSKHQRKAVAGGDKSINYTTENGHQGKVESVRTAAPAVKNRKGSFFNSFRKPKQTSQTAENVDTQKNSDERSLNQEKNSGDAPYASKLPPQQSLDQSFDRSISTPGAASPESSSFTAVGPTVLKSTSPLPSSSNLPPRSLNIPKLADARIIAPSTMSSIQSNVLDSPGEDIEFIDISDSESRERHNDQTLDSIYMTEFEMDKRVRSPPKPPRSFGRRLGVASTSVAAVAREQPEYDELDGLHNQQSEATAQNPNSDAMYSMFAQKLIDIGDSYSASVSDQRPAPDAQVPEKRLTDLEKEIIEYIRSLGDKSTKKSKEDMYRRFYCTMQNSLGSELSWNHVAFLFYTTKELISAVGRGSQAAVLIKDFTVQYVSETCASWIVDQGGFDILLSSEESDFGVD
uniref:Uncharacterized protein n=1 Tax=Arion vulgaris TaxID=1028688 RepID=A0A0B7AMU3_9EUPU